MAPVTPILERPVGGNTGPPPSGNWSTGFIAFTGGLVVTSGKFAHSGTGAFRQGAWWSAGQFLADQEIYCTVSNSGKLAGDGMTLGLRLAQVASGTVDGYALGIDYSGATTSWSIWRITDGATPVISSIVSQNVANGESVLFSAVGSTLTGYLYTGGSWASIVSVTDTTYASAGYIGMDLTRVGQTWQLTNVGGGSYPVSGQTNIMVA